ncbi:hypothetical protein ERO13_D10G181575v2 [Gossypium hirsutum]|uniref:Uncharacterized protein n=3 Tax=Gossypium TaxID=3633 RepID=A0A5J5PTQ4_GOSBA|nr:hypothetical protein ES319_D10G202700v1 [Gossypium barbadense]KAB2009969.1 hypothetical protein ES319_D10G202700v1 [Gossypium barbadense]KAG4126859.1 hypothetical protein ERO13_D10G181575v2 [Gossypium hirsutum]TYG50977.1 hypothetical protein ES288_D10G218800v1 [Gossypium darwinii]TYI61922.1 hypothetical protein E1A91_D10G207400v1 [Gossypium mustelinum]
MSLMHAKKVKLSHFFNTFFYKKLVNLESGYNYRAIKRWTSQRKVGYCLLDCDKEHMAYFRLRTAKEILKLKVD